MILLLPVVFVPPKLFKCVELSIRMVLTEEDEMIIALCLIIIAVAMQNFKISQLICSINFLHQPIILGAFEYLCLKTYCLPFLCVCVKIGACTMCTHLTASIGD